MTKWIVTVKDHPYVEDDDYTFGRLDKLEGFVGGNDIQCDHVTELIKIDTVENTRTPYLLSEIVPVGGIRLVLEVNRKALSHDRSCNNCPVKVVNG